jgi:hypothetical protein
VSDELIDRRSYGQTRAFSGCERPQPKKLPRGPLNKEARGSLGI